MFDKHGVYRVIYYNFLHTLYNNIPFETGMRFQMKDMPIHVGQDKRYTVVADSMEYVVSSVTVSDDGEEEVIVLEEDDTDTPIFYIPDETGLRKIDLRETFKFCLSTEVLQKNCPGCRRAGAGGEPRGSDTELEGRDRYRRGPQQQAEYQNQGRRGR